jgi:dienelactone hydrolase
VSAEARRVRPLSNHQLSARILRVNAWCTARTLRGLMSSPSSVAVRLILLGSSLLGLVACSPPPSATDAGDAATSDVALDSAPDGAPDGAADGAAVDDALAPADVTAPPACMVSTARIAQGAGPMALAAAPARCGQPAHRWLTEGPMGSVLELGPRNQYARTTLALATTMIDETARYDVTTDVVAYQTQDRGRLVRATTLVAYPRNVRDPQRLDVLLVLHGTAGFRDGCGPSASNDTKLLAAAFASTGYVVVAPDYIGLNSFGADTMQPHPYLVGQPTAIASLDATRAAIRHVASLGSTVCASSRVVAIGGSQGGHAALWIDRLAPYYAQELSIEGIVATVPPADLVGEANRALSADVEATKNMMAFWGSSSDWYGLGARLGDVFNAPYDRDIPAALRASCSPDVRTIGLETAFTPAVRMAATAMTGVGAYGDLGCMVRENSLPSTSVARIAPTSASYGVLYVTGESDTLVTTSIQREAFTTLCTAGMRMQYLECAGASHTRATTWALPEILAFAKDRLAGRPMAGPVCMLQAASRCRNTPMGM